MDENNKNIQIFISTPSTKTFVVEIDPSTTNVLELKKIIKDREGIDVDKQRLIHRGKQMNDNFYLSHYNVERDSIIKLVLRLLG